MTLFDEIKNGGRTGRLSPARLPGDQTQSNAVATGLQPAAADFSGAGGGRKLETEPWWLQGTPSVTKLRLLSFKMFDIAGGLHHKSHVLKNRAS